MRHSDDDELRAAREELVRHCVRLLDDGLAIATAGNLSVRLGRTVLITPSGLGYQDLEAADMVAVGLDSPEPEPASWPAESVPGPADLAAEAGEPGASAGEPGASAGEPGASVVAPGTSAGEPGTSAGEPGTSAGEPGASVVAPGASVGALGASSVASSELPLHLAIYAATDATAVVHTHSPEVVALSAVRDELPAIHYAITELGGPVRVAPYARFGSQRLAQAAVTALAGRRAVILRNHGSVTYGTGLAQAYERALLLEWLARVYRMACSLGEPRTLTASELDEVAAEVRRRGYGQGRRHRRDR